MVPPQIESVVENCASTEQMTLVRQVCEQVKAPLSRLLLLGMAHLDWPKAENANALETRARHEVLKLERGLVVLEIIVGIVPSSLPLASKTSSFMSPKMWRRRW